MRLLIIEDEPSIILALYRALASLYTVDSVGTFSGSMKKLGKNEYDAIILDLSLPDASGLSVCERIREQGMTTPILVLSGSIEIFKKVELLDSGANDYLTKPFSIEELKARLRVLLRQPESPAGAHSRLVVGDLILDSIKHEVQRAGKHIELRKKEFAVLECLMQNAGRVVSRNSLTEYAWEEQGYNLTNTIDVHIKYLRDKIDRPFKTQLIKTVHGLGYKIDVSNLQEHSNIKKERRGYERVASKSSH